MVRCQLQVRSDVAHTVSGVLGREGPRRRHGRGRHADCKEDGSEELAREHGDRGSEVKTTTKTRQGRDALRTEDLSWRPSSDNVGLFMV